MKETYERFCDLKANLSKQHEVLNQIISEMRDNLIARNDNKRVHVTYATQEKIDIPECDLDGLYSVDASLHHYKK